jgi:hypothetical protein
MTLPAGLGDRHNACSLAAINLALSGRLADDVPDCMSDVIGQWIIGVQDAMPDEMRNSARWKDLLPRAAGTGKMHEAERLAVILDWMWGTVLPACQPLADSAGLGSEWRRMTTERTHTEAARAAACAAWAAARAVWVADAAARAAACAAWAAARAVWVADAAARAAACAAWAEAACAAVCAAEAAARAVWPADAERAAAWDRFDPCTLLQKLVEVSE